MITNAENSDNTFQAVGVDPPNFKDRKLNFLFFLTLVFIIVAIFSLFFLLSGQEFQTTFNQQAAAKVNDEIITLAKVEKLATDCNIDQKKAVELLVDEKVLSLWAKDEGEIISKKEQEAEEIRISGKPSTTECITIEARVNLLNEKLSFHTQGFREGKFILINFSKYNPVSEFFALPSDVKDEADRQQKQNEERSYADSLAQSIYKDIAAGSISFEDAMVKAQSDPRVGLKGWYETTLQSGSFTADDYTNHQGLLNFDVVREHVDRLAEGQFSELFLQSIPFDDYNSESQLVDVRWIIAKIDRIGKGLGGSPEQLLESLKDQYDAEIYDL